MKPITIESNCFIPKNLVRKSGMQNFMRNKINVLTISRTKKTLTKCWRLIRKWCSRNLQLPFSITQSCWLKSRRNLIWILCNYNNHYKKVSLICKHLIKDHYVGLTNLVPTPCGMENIRTLINFWPNLKFIKKTFIARQFLDLCFYIFNDQILQNITILRLLKFLQSASFPYNTNLWQECEVWIFGTYDMKQLWHSLDALKMKLIVLVRSPLQPHQDRKFERSKMLTCKCFLSTQKKKLVVFTTQT